VERSGAQNFVFNVILEFLKLQDIVKILTIVRTNQGRIFPSALLLEEILQKALLPSSLDIFFQHPTLLLLSEDKTVPLQTLRKLYHNIKSIKSEFEPCVDITINDRVCSFWTHVEQEKEEG
jgi:hypothetical protein